MKLKGVGCLRAASFKASLHAVGAVDMASVLVVAGVRLYRDALVPDLPDELDGIAAQVIPGDYHPDH
jgi:hypothetical protein